MVRTYPLLSHGLRLSWAVLFCLLLASCNERSRPEPPVERLATDVHVSIGGNILTLPFAALEDIAYRKMSFSLDRTDDRERAKEAADDFLLSARDRESPLVLSDLSVLVDTYGWNDSDLRQRAMCPLLTREWARSVCDNPWAAIRQALPYDGFTLVDLGRLPSSGVGRPFNCVASSIFSLSFPKNLGEPAILCQSQVITTRDNVFYTAIVRIDGSMGAAWTVWSNGQNGETAEAMVEREGEAIISFVKKALGAQERFDDLQRIMCRLRRPGATDSPEGPDCRAVKTPFRL